MREFPITPVEDQSAVESFLSRWMDYYDWKVRSCEYANEIQLTSPTLPGSAFLECGTRFSRQGLEMMAYEAAKLYESRADFLNNLYLYVKQEQVEEMINNESSQLVEV